MKWMPAPQRSFSITSQDSSNRMIVTLQHEFASLRNDRGRQVQGVLAAVFLFLWLSIHQALVESGVGQVNGRVETAAAVSLRACIRGDDLLCPLRSICMHARYPTGRA